MTQEEISACLSVIVQTVNGIAEIVENGVDSYVYRSIVNRL